MARIDPSCQLSIVAVPVETSFDSKTNKNNGKQNDEHDDFPHTHTRTHIHTHTYTCTDSLSENADSLYRRLVRVPLGLSIKR